MVATEAGKQQYQPNGKNNEPVVATNGHSSAVQNGHDTLSPATEIEVWFHGVMATHNAGRQPKNKEANVPTHTQPGETTAVQKEQDTTEKPKQGSTILFGEGYAFIVRDGYRYDIKDQAARAVISYLHGRPGRMEKTVELAHRSRAIFGVARHMKSIPTQVKDIVLTEGRNKGMRWGLNTAYTLEPADPLAMYPYPPREKEKRESAPESVTEETATAPARNVVPRRLEAKFGLAYAINGNGEPMSAEELKLRSKLTSKEFATVVSRVEGFVTVETDGKRGIMPGILASISGRTILGPATLALETQPATNGHDSTTPLIELTEESGIEESDTPDVTRPEKIVSPTNETPRKTAAISAILELTQNADETIDPNTDHAPSAEQKLIGTATVINGTLTLNGRVISAGSNAARIILESLAENPSEDTSNAIIRTRLHDAKLVAHATLPLTVRRINERAGMDIIQHLGGRSVQNSRYHFHPDIRFKFEDGTVIFARQKSLVKNVPDESANLTADVMPRETPPDTTPEIVRPTILIAEDFSFIFKDGETIKIVDPILRSLLPEMHKRGRQIATVDLRNIAIREGHRVNNGIGVMVFNRLPPGLRQLFTSKGIGSRKTFGLNQDYSWQLTTEAELNTAPITNPVAAKAETAERRRSQVVVGENYDFIIRDGKWIGLNSSSITKYLPILASFPGEKVSVEILDADAKNDTTSAEIVFKALPDKLRDLFIVETIEGKVTVQLNGAMRWTYTDNTVLLDTDESEVNSDIATPEAEPAVLATAQADATVEVKAESAQPSEVLLNLWASRLAREFRMGSIDSPLLPEELRERARLNPDQFALSLPYAEEMVTVTMETGRGLLPKVTAEKNGITILGPAALILEAIDPEMQSAPIATDPTELVEGQPTEIKTTESSPAMPQAALQNTQGTTVVTTEVVETASPATMPVAVKPKDETIVASSERSEVRIPLPPEVPAASNPERREFKKPAAVMGTNYDHVILRSRRIPIDNPTLQAILPELFLQGRQVRTGKLADYARRAGVPHTQKDIALAFRSLPIEVRELFETRGDGATRSWGLINPSNWQIEGEGRMDSVSTIFPSTVTTSTVKPGSISHVDPWAPLPFSPRPAIPTPPDHRETATPQPVEPRAHHETPLKTRIAVAQDYTYAIIDGEKIPINHLALRAVLQITVEHYGSRVPAKEVLQFTKDKTGLKMPAGLISVLSTAPEQLRKLVVNEGWSKQSVYFANPKYDWQMEGSDEILQSNLDQDVQAPIPTPTPLRRQETATPQPAEQKATPTPLPSDEMDSDTNTGYEITSDDVAAELAAFAEILDKPEKPVPPSRRPIPPDRVRHGAYGLPRSRSPWKEPVPDPEPATRQAVAPKPAAPPPAPRPATREPAKVTPRPAPKPIDVIMTPQHVVPPAIPYKAIIFDDISPERAQSRVKFGVEVRARAEEPIPHEDLVAKSGLSSDKLTETIAPFLASGEYLAVELSDGRIGYETKAQHKTRVGKEVVIEEKRSGRRSDEDELAYLVRAAEESVRRAKAVSAGEILEN
jgi:hypothetical protein